MTGVPVQTTFDFYERDRYGRINTRLSVSREDGGFCSRTVEGPAEDRVLNSETDRLDRES